MDKIYGEKYFCLIGWPDSTWSSSLECCTSAWMGWGILFFLETLLSGAYAHEVSAVVSRASLQEAVETFAFQG